MIIVMRKDASAEERKQVEDRIIEAGLEPHSIVGKERTVIGAVGDERDIGVEFFQSCAGVEQVMPILAPYKRASRELQAEKTVVKFGNAAVGSKKIALIAGPCTVENRQQTIDIAKAVRDMGAVALRGGAFKPRTNPYEFQGLAEDGLRMLADAREATGLPIVTEVMTPADVPLVAKYADVLQVGARNMQNFLLLTALGECGKPVLLKRGIASQLDEFLLAAEYILKHGNSQVMLCERGVRTFENHTRNTLSLSIVPAVIERSHLPIVVDPSHGTGKVSLVIPMSLAAVACGADALIVEVHSNPKEALVDGPQSLDFKQFGDLVKRVRPVAEAVGREI